MHVNMKVAEVAVQFFVTNDKPNVAGLVLAGSADFKTELSQSDLFDQRLRNIILSVVDVSYGESFHVIWLHLLRSCICGRTCRFTNFCTA